MLVHRRVTLSIKFAGTHLYTWVERGTVRVKCLAYEHNAMSPARSRTRTAQSGVERTNHEATAPHTTYVPERLQTRQVTLQMNNYLQYLYSPLHGMLVYQRVTPSINLTSSHFTLGWREAL